jgi:hypothetical protein
MTRVLVSATSAIRRAGLGGAARLWGLLIAEPRPAVKHCLQAGIGLMLLPVHSSIWSA